MQLCIKESGDSNKVPSQLLQFPDFPQPDNAFTIKYRWEMEPKTRTFLSKWKGLLLPFIAIQNQQCLSHLSHPHTLLPIHSKLILLEAGRNRVKTGKIVLPQENKALPRGREDFTGKLKILPTFILECFLSMYYMYKKWCSSVLA